MSPRLTGYGLAVIGVGVTLVVKLLLDPMIGRDAPFLLFFAPVMISAWHGGMGPGLAATILAALVSDFFFIPPLRAVLSGHRETLLHVAVFALESVFITVLCAGLRQARRRAETSARDARTLGAERSRLLEVESAARARAAFVAEASRVLAGSFDDEAALKGLAALAVPAFADACVVDLLADAGTITRVTAVHRDPSQSQHALALLRHPTDAPDSHPLLAVLRTGKSELYAEPSPAVRRVLAGTTEPGLPGGGCHVESAMIVPLVARGRTLGALSFVSERAQRRYGPAELAVAEDVARRTALAVDHARVYREAEEARRRFQDLVQSLQEVVWEADSETFRFTFVSRHAEELLGYPLEQWLERDFLGRLVHPDDRARVMVDRESARRAGRGHDLEYRALAVDGQAIWVRDIGKIVPDTEGAGRHVRGVMVDVTARKRGEEALSQVASIVESSGDAILGTTVDGTILTWNTGAERLYGYRASEVVGRSLELLVPPDRPAEVGRLSARLKDGEHIVGFETVRVARDGRRLDVALTLSPVRDASGAMVGVSAIGRDITDRKRTERRLGAQYAVSRVLAESATLADAAPRVLRAVGGGLGLTVGALWIVDADAGLLRCAETWYVGAPPTTAFETLIRQTTFAPGAGVPGRAWLARAPVWVADVTQEPDLPAALGAARADLRSAFAFPVRGNSGVLGVVDFFSREIRTPDPDLILMVGAVGHQLGQFIERRKAELAVRESEALKGAMLEMSVDGIITIDHKGRVAEFNPAAERIFGHPRSKALGRELAELIVPPGLREQYRASFAHSLATGEGQVIGQQSEMMAVRADGSEFPVELAIIRIPLPFPRPPVFTGYVRDIGERKRAEAAERSAEALRSVARLANAAGHEINNPLTVIITSLEMLGKDLEAGRVSPARIKPIVAAAERIRDVIAHMRRMTRLETVSREPHLPEMLDLRESSE